MWSRITCSVISSTRGLLCNVSLACSLGGDAVVHLPKPTHLEGCEFPTSATEDVSLVLAGADHQLFVSYYVSIPEITNYLVNPIASGYVLPTPKMANRFQASSISQ